MFGLDQGNFGNLAFGTDAVDAHWQQWQVSDDWKVTALSPCYGLCPPGQPGRRHIDDHDGRHALDQMRREQPLQ